MLGGIDPILLFNFSKAIPVLGSVSEIPVLADAGDTFPLPPIPIYLSETLTGIYIDTEDKNMDIDTSVDTTKAGTTPETNQKAINNTVTINMLAKKDSIGVILLSALMDVVYPRVTSKEYTISYLHGAVIVLNGLLHSFSMNQDSNTDLIRISLQLTRTDNSTQPKSGVPVVGGSQGTTPLTAGQN